MNSVQQRESRESCRCRVKCRCRARGTEGERTRSYRQQGEDRSLCRLEDSKSECERKEQQGQDSEHTEADKRRQSKTLSVAIDLGSVASNSTQRKPEKHRQSQRQRDAENRAHVGPALGAKSSLSPRDDPRMLPLKTVRIPPTFRMGVLHMEPRYNFICPI